MKNLFNYKAFGNTIRNYRKERNLTIEQLAEEIGISWNYLGDIERGIKESISIPTVLLLLNYLNISFSDCFDKKFEKNKIIIDKINNKLMAFDEYDLDYILSTIISLKRRL